MVLVIVLVMVPPVWPVGTNWRGMMARLINCVLGGGRGVYEGRPPHDVELAARFPDSVSSVSRFGR